VVAEELTKPTVVAVAVLVAARLPKAQQVQVTLGRIHQPKETTEALGSLEAITPFLVVVVVVLVVLELLQQIYKAVQVEQVHLHIIQLTFLLGYQQLLQV
jgi:hypothetical protein